MFDPKIWRLCLVTDRGLSLGRPLVDVVAQAVSGGVTMVQLREKDCTTREFLEEARALKALLAPLGVPLVINDRIDIALAVNADGVHVGQTDMPVEIARAIGRAPIRRRGRALTRCSRGGGVAAACSASCTRPIPSGGKPACLRRKVDSDCPRLGTASLRASGSKSRSGRRSMVSTAAPSVSIASRIGADRA